jgi:predicted DNA-binding ribbon-helix-helix protein
MQKRSLTIAGHRTSIALEPEFWAAMEAIADRRGLRLTALIEDIDRTREGPNLSSALRVAVLQEMQARLEP